MSKDTYLSFQQQKARLILRALTENSRREGEVIRITQGDKAIARDGSHTTMTLRAWEGLLTQRLNMLNTARLTYTYAATPTPHQPYGAASPPPG